MTLKPVISIIVGAAAFGLTFYADSVRSWPLILQWILFITIAALVFYTGGFFDLIKEVRENEKLRSKNKQLKLGMSNTSQDLSELQKVVVLFLEHSEIYRQKVKEFLKLNDDYLCIVKSSEGLSDVFNSLENKDKEMLPFGSILKKIPGSIQPFERIGLFLIPLNSLPGITPRNIRKYVDKEIIPEVIQERKRFLAKLPKGVSVKADEFSFKYIAFFLKQDSITYDIKNRKFNHDFVSFIVSGQNAKSLEKMTEKLEEVVKTKDVLTLVDWSSFAKMNKDQKKFVEVNRERINEQLRQFGFTKLSDFYEKSEEDFYKAIRPVFSKKKLSKKKAENFAKKIVEGARNTIDILRKNGVNL